MHGSQFEIKMMNILSFFVCIICVANASPRPQTSSVPLNCTRPNEEYQCGSACQTTCLTFNTPCPIVNIKCNDACYCIEKYARDMDGTCIPDNSPECERLKPQKCEENEVWDCRFKCDQRCISLGQPCEVLSLQCVPGCYCKDGYARNQQNYCIRNDTVPCQTISKNKPCGEHEIWDCNGACQTTCEKYGQPCGIYPFVCIGNCFCEEGFARNKHGKCIWADSDECNRLKPCI